ncbi:MAG: cytochrome c [Terriglobales bacterium]
MKKILVVMVVLAMLVVIAAPTLMADDGAKVFAAKCAMCHGPDGAGKMKGTPDFRTAAFQAKSDAELTNAIANGPNGKESHAFAKKGMDEATIKSLVAYIRTLKK